jgi:hypothetical protein
MLILQHYAPVADRKGRVFVGEKRETNEDDEEEDRGGGAPSQGVAVKDVFALRESLSG